MIHSQVQQGSRVSFPAFLGERVYMRKFRKEQGLPLDLKRWQDTVDQMLEGVDAPRDIFLMVDQGIVKANFTHRRPGLHVDGYWMDYQSGHEQKHGHSNYWKTEEKQRTGQHDRHMHGGNSDELLILASDVYGCDAYEGTTLALPEQGGDCSHIDTYGMNIVEMEPNRAWRGRAVDMLHQARILTRDCQRTVVRLNVQQ